jgi:hypothetical protein
MTGVVHSFQQSDLEEHPSSYYGRFVLKYFLFSFFPPNFYDCEVRS